LGLFGIAFSLAVFPSLSALIAKNSKDEFIRLFSKTLRRILFFVLPVSALIIVLRAQIVRVILGSGHFDWNDTIVTFTVLGVLSVSLFAQSVIPLLTRAFFALQNTKTPLYVAMVSEAANIFLIIVLIDRFQITGIALAFSLATTLNMLLLYYFLGHSLREQWSHKAILTPVAKIILASLGAGLVAQLTKSLFGFNDVRLDTFVEIFAQLAVTSLAGGSAFLLLSWAMKIEELENLKHFLLRRVMGQPQTIVESEDQIEKGRV
jgi:putative peptidoglycan lipid II flippase